MHYDYLIVGAGLFGSVFAREMTDAGRKCLVIEKRNHVAGNIYTKDTEGIQVHEYGAHIFHTSDRKVWQYVNRFAEFNHFVNSPMAVYGTEIYNLPFNMNTFSKMWNIKTPKEAEEKILEQIRDLQIGEPANLEEQALSLVGRDIYEKLVKGYTEKQWGRDCRELPAFIIKRLPVRFTYDNNYFNDTFQGIPQKGYTDMVMNILKDIPLMTGTDYFDKREEWKKSGEVTYNKLVFTGMLDEFFSFSLGRLEYRSLRFEQEYLSDCDNFQGNAVINYTERNIPYTRIIEHKHFAFGCQKGTVITREYPQEWKLGDEPYYPVNDEKNDSLFQRYRKLAESEEKVLFGGRLGMYRYYDMDKVIAEALLLAEKEV